MKCDNIIFKLMEYYYECNKIGYFSSVQFYYNNCLYDVLTIPEMHRKTMNRKKLFILLGMFAGVCRSTQQMPITIGLKVLRNAQRKNKQRNIQFY